MKEYIFPRRIVRIQCREGEENLLRRQTLQIGLSETVTTVFDKGDYVILDFGVELCGGIRILTAGFDSAQVRIRFGESLTECCAELGGRQNATNDHALRDMTVTLPFLSDMTFGNTGFRFVRLDFLGKAALKCAVAVNHIYKGKEIYRYMGPDEKIVRIFDTAKRTMDLCASSGFICDGVKRDRLV